MAYHLTATVDPDLCLGARSCVRIAPWYFTLGEDGIATALQDADIGDDLDAVIEAIESCPNGAITLVPPTGS